MIFLSFFCNSNMETLGVNNDIELENEYNNSLYLKLCLSNLFCRYQNPEFNINDILINEPKLRNAIFDNNLCNKLHHSIIENDIY